MLRVWFHELRPTDWYGGGEAVDRLIEKRFAHLLPGLGNRPPHEFLSDTDTALAAIILFDQVPRNIHRGSAASYAYDGLAVSITHGLVARGALVGMTKHQRQFALMPLMHSEAIADQRLSPRLFARWVPSALSFARSHWRMIARFGRFPHRNDVLGRKTTPAEQHAIDAGFSW